MSKVPARNCVFASPKAAHRGPKWRLVTRLLGLGPDGWLNISSMTRIAIPVATTASRLKS